MDMETNVGSSDDQRGRPVRSGTGLAVVYEHGILRPESNLELPDQTRLTITIGRVETTPEAENHGRLLLHELRQRGTVRLGSWHPRREELQERG